ncbi:mannosyltransferase [Rhizina undulata]
MEKISFWNREPGLPAARLASKRIFVRVISLLALLVLCFHFFTSVELRNTINEKVSQTVTPILGHDHETCKFQNTPKFNATEKATLVMLVRNRELREALSSMRNVEDRFNKNFHYPWTFMNDEPFTADFIKYTSGMASGPVEYAQIPKENWSIPESLNKTTIYKGMDNLVRQGVIYGGSLSYRHMCRFNSGFFYNQEVMMKYEWYWRVEPGIELYCDINYDPFTFMRENGKVYGFVITMYEFLATIPTLWARTREFVANNPQFLAINNALGYLVDGANATKDGDKTIDGPYNLCHFWSNFEIGSLEFYRSEAYTKYFEFLDSTGGFFYERWGDAPVHSIALSLFLPKDKIHHFADIGYNHAPAARCPQDEESHSSGRCFCNRQTSFDTDSYSCLPRWWKIAGKNKGATRE